VLFQVDAPMRLQKPFKLNHLHFVGHYLGKGT